MFVRRLSATFVAAGAAVVLAAGPANAHFCFKTFVNEHAQQGMAGSNGWATFEELAFQFTGLCTAGIEVLADAGGVSLGTPIKSSGVMAGGTLKKGPDSGNKAVDHLDFGAIEAALGDAAAACD